MKINVVENKVRGQEINILDPFKYNILYYLINYSFGTSYKNITLLQNNFGGEIIRNTNEAINKITKDKVDFMVVIGDYCENYKLALKYNIPYLLIEQDIGSLRTGIPLNEQEMIENATAIQFVSQEHLDYCKKYNLPFSRVIHTRPLKKDLEFEPLPKLEGLNLVYSGGITGRKQASGWYAYRMYVDIFKRFIENGWNVHIYPSNTNELEDYKEVGCIIHDTISPEHLPRELSQYTAGLQSYNKTGVEDMPYNYAQTSMPNKLWDYLAAGIPTIGYQGGIGMKLYKDKWGIEIKNLSNTTIKEIPKRLEKLNITDKLRYENVQDNDLPIYQELIDEMIKEVEKRKSLKIKYYLGTWDAGTSYKNITLMKENFGGEITREASELIKSIINDEVDMTIVEGDNLRTYQIPLRYGIPYILIEHDITGMRTGNPANEKERLENATAVIFTSQYHADYCLERYNIPYWKIIHTRPLKKDLDFTPLPKLEGLHLVYAGGVLEPDRRDSHYGYRMYFDIFKRFIDNGWNVHIYPASVYNLKDYQKLGCIIHDKVPCKELFRQMSQYTAGLQSYNKDGVPKMAYEYTQSCMPNKLWDYLAAGIPTIGFQGGKGMEVYRNKWGIEIKSLSDNVIKSIPKRLEKLVITDEVRYENVQDNDLNIYQEIFDKLKEEVAYRKTLPKTKPPISLLNETNALIIVENKRPYDVCRGGIVFGAKAKSDILQVSVDRLKEIKAHVGLKVFYV